jgi:hypothetical protein
VRGAVEVLLASKVDCGSRKTRSRCAQRHLGIFGVSAMPPPSRLTPR